MNYLKRISNEATRGRAEAALALLMVVCTGINLYIFASNRSGRSARPLQQGDSFPSFRPVRTYNGGSRTDTRRPVYDYWFSPTCHWCERNLPNAVALANSPALGADFVGLAVESADLSSYMVNRGIHFKVLGIDPMDPIVRRLGATPSTYVANPKAKLERSWVGAYGGKLKDEIEHYSHTALPGGIEGGGTVVPSSLARKAAK